MEGSRYRLSEKAATDLEEVWFNVYDQSLNLEIADRVIDEIYDGFRLLGENPGAGHFREDLFPKPVKFWSVYSYLIIYKIETHIQIVRVIPGQRDVATILKIDPI